MRLKNIWFRIRHWENWDWRLKYILISPAWFWFCLRARSCWFFTASNPTITFGGFDGESKKQIYDQLPPGTYPKTIFVSRNSSFHQVETLLEKHSWIAYPVAVKPDVAKMGLLFRKIHDLSALEAYHNKINADYLIQEFIQYPLEVSVFYYRFPNDDKGQISGFLKKEFLKVTGDGNSTLWKLMLNYPRVRYRLEELKAKHRDKLGWIVPRNKEYILSHALNLSRGGKLVSLIHEKDEQLLKVFDDLSNFTKHFYYGRYDIKCQSIEDLKQGKNYSILEYNGSGAEPHHVYASDLNLWQACSILIRHWKILYQISRLNHKIGIPYWRFSVGWRFLKASNKHLKTLQHLDLEA